MLPADQRNQGNIKMSGTDETFHYTKEDVRKLESRESKLHGGEIPKDADSSILKVSSSFMTSPRLTASPSLAMLISLLTKSIVDSKSNADVIAERQANLPLPEQPPVASDWNSADASKVNVGSGGVSADVSYGKGTSGLRGPATGESSVRTDGEQSKTNTAPDSGVGREGKDNLDRLPEDALAK